MSDAPLALEFPPELIEQIAQRAAEILDDRRPGADTPQADGWLRGAEAIAKYISAPVSRVYALASCNPPRIPIEKDGSALLARRSDLDAWIVSGGGKRP